MQEVRTYLHVGHTGVIPHIDSTQGGFYICRVGCHIGGWRYIDIAVIVIEVIVVVDTDKRSNVCLRLAFLVFKILPSDGEQTVVAATAAQSLTCHLATYGRIEHRIFYVVNIFIMYLTNHLMVRHQLIGDGTVGKFEQGNRNFRINSIPDTGHDIGLMDHVLTNHRIVDGCNLRIHDKIGDRCHLDIYQFHIAAVLIGCGVELERLEPRIHSFALFRHVIAFMQPDKLCSEGTVAAEHLYVGLTVFLRVHHPVFFLRTSFLANAIGERDTSLLIDAIARVNHMTLHSGA